MIKTQWETFGTHETCYLFFLIEMKVFLLFLFISLPNFKIESSEPTLDCTTKQIMNELGIQVVTMLNTG